jgi:hypothetical protein
MFHLPSVEQCICLLAMCIVQCCNLQALRIRNLGEGIDEFGHKLMCILESLATFQHALVFNTFKYVANSSLYEIEHCKTKQHHDEMITQCSSFNNNNCQLVNLEIELNPNS